MRISARRAAGATERMPSKVLLTNGHCDAVCTHWSEKRHVFSFAKRGSTIQSVWPRRIDIVRYGKYRPKRDPLASRNRDRPAYH